MILVHEHARLTTVPLQEEGMHQRCIPPSAFDWLCRQGKLLGSGGVSLVQLEDRRWLRLDGHVGLIETPCGTRIEILPKTVDGNEDPARSRATLLAMLQRCLDLPVRDLGETSLQTMHMPVSEWIMQQFLLALETLVQRGVRCDYHAEQDQLRHLRGRLLIAQQLRQPAGRAHLFQVEHQVFDADRPENRLIRCALDKVRGLTREPRNWRLSHELAHVLHEVPASRDTTRDFQCWRDDRLMAHYRSIRPWVSMILGEHNPLAMLGQWQGRSLLFPMQRVFERFVGWALRRHLPAGMRLREQAASQSLCRHDSGAMFQLQPDFLIDQPGMRWVGDAKWKRLDAGNRANKYGINQGDLYQLFAYGHKYLGGKGKMSLIYPRTSAFDQALPLFFFDNAGALSLEVIPVDLRTGELVGTCLEGRGQV